MKKLYLLMVFFITLFFGACSSDSSKDAFTGEEKKQSEEVVTEESLLDGMEIYFGDLHCHTIYSWGEETEGTPEDHFNHAKETGLDFTVITDHDFWLISSALVGIDNWTPTQEAADAANVNGEFVALRGFEWSNPLLGHINVFGTLTYMDTIRTALIPDIYKWIDKNDGIAQFNHPGKEPITMQGGKGYAFNNMKFDKKVVDNFCLIETANWNNGNNQGDFLPYYIMALDNGWKISPAGNQDNHTLKYMSTYRTGVIAPELTREGLFESIRARRTYSTDDPNIRVIFKAGDFWMGTEFANEDDSVELTVMVNDDEPISIIQIYSNKGTIVAAKPFYMGEKSVLWKVSVPCKPGDYFFARIVSKDSNDDEALAKSGLDYQVAVTAPVWITE